MRFETGTEGKVAWLDGARAIPIYVAGSGPKMLSASYRTPPGPFLLHHANMR